MRLSINRPEKICWITIPVILLIGLPTANNTFDLQLHDTYFVISNLHLGVLFSIFLAFLGAGYWIINNIDGNLSKFFSWIHMIVTIGTMLLILLFTFLAEFQNAVDPDYTTLSLIDVGMSFVMMAFILCQPIYLLNLVIGFLRRKR
jgi:heme/copper-type cytochrome/quinol oxidase subunit 1